MHESVYGMWHSKQRVPVSFCVKKLCVGASVLAGLVTLTLFYIPIDPPLRVPAITTSAVHQCHVQISDFFASSRPLETHHFLRNISFFDIHFFDIYSYPLVIIDKFVLSCLIDSNSKDCAGLNAAGMVRFGALDTYWSCIINQVHKRLKSGGHVVRRQLRIINDSHIVIRDSIHSNITYIISKIVTKGYWYVPEYSAANKTLDAFATFPFKLSRLVGQGHKWSMVFGVPENIVNYLWQLRRSRFIDCHRLLAEQFASQNAKFYKRAPLIPDSALDDLSYLMDVLVELSMTPVLWGGTNLGWFRECGIIRDTTDLDLTIFENELHPNLEQRLIDDKRLSLFWILGRKNDSYEFSLYTKNNIKIDVFCLHNRYGPKSWVGGMYVPNRTKLRWNYPPIGDDDICTSDLKGHLVYVVCDPVSVLQADYGSLWYKPHTDQKFVWYKSHSNIQTNGRWSLREWKEVYRIKFT